jgi:putative oxidoreductase
MKIKTDLTALITFIAAVLLLMLWGYAAVSKIVEHEKFVQQMKLAPVPLMKVMGPILGWLVPFIELLLVWFLFKDRHREWGLWLSFLLLLIFQIYIVAMLLSGLDLPCTCGGLISKLQWKQHLVFNGIFMVIAALPLIYQRVKNRSNLQDGYSPRSIYN